MATAAGVGFAIIFIVKALASNHPTGSGRSIPNAEAALTRTATRTPDIADRSPVPRWVGRREATWARDGSRTIEFELQATRDVPVWMTRVRPLLIVRCLYHATEVFVSTGSAASVEADAVHHTVRVRIDDDPETPEQWVGSESEQELFAPDGIALARRLARAHRLRFGFTPYNARAVTAEFAVQGFDRLVGLVARTCGWRVEGAVTSTAAISRRPSPRTAR